jgi:hypothetical protein
MSCIVVQVVTCTVVCVVQIRFMFGACVMHHSVLCVLRHDEGGVCTVRHNETCHISCIFTLNWCYIGGAGRDDFIFTCFARTIHSDKYLIECDLCKYRLQFYFYRKRCFFAPISARKIVPKKHRVHPIFSENKIQNSITSRIF